MRPYRYGDEEAIPYATQAESARMNFAANETIRQGGFVDVLLIDGAAAGLFGVAPDSRQGVGNMWFHSAPVLERKTHAIAFIRASRELVALTLEKYDTLYNVFIAETDGLAKWLTWLGAEIWRDPTSGGLMYVINKDTEKHPWQIL